MLRGAKETLTLSHINTLLGIIMLWMQRFQYRSSDDTRGERRVFGSSESTQRDNMIRHRIIISSIIIMIAPFGCRGYVHYVFEFWCSFPQLTTTTMVGIEQCCWMGGLWAECVCGSVFQSISPKSTVKS